MSFRTVNGTATTGDNDYVSKTGTLTFAPGETTKTITIEVKGDSKREVGAATTAGSGRRVRRGSKVHAAVDTLGNLLAVKVTAANEQERAEVADLSAAVQNATGQTVTLAYVDRCQFEWQSR